MNTARKLVRNLQSFEHICGILEGFAIIFAILLIVCGVDVAMAGLGL